MRSSFGLGFGLRLGFLGNLAPQDHVNEADDYNDDSHDDGVELVAEENATEKHNEEPLAEIGIEEVEVVEEEHDIEFCECQHDCEQPTSPSFVHEVDDSHHVEHVDSIREDERDGKCEHGSSHCQPYNAIHADYVHHLIQQNYQASNSNGCRSYSSADVFFEILGVWQFYS